MAIHAQLCSEDHGFPFMCGSQEWMNMENGFNQFCFNLQQKQELEKDMQQKLLDQLQRNQNNCFENCFVYDTHPSSMAISQSIAIHVEEQLLEIDEYIRSQNERLSLALEEQRKQQYTALLKRMESKTQILLRQKDEEIAQATKRRMELEEFLRKLETENQAWQRVAQEKEAMVISLNNTLDQMREKACYCFNNEADDAESCCDMYTENEEEGKGKGTKEEKTGDSLAKTMLCKCCNSRNSSVLFLPCRHLCSCKDCEAVLDSCLVCGTSKKASIKALIF